MLCFLKNSLICKKDHWDRNIEASSLGTGDLNVSHSNDIEVETTFEIKFVVCVMIKSCDYIYYHWFLSRAVSWMFVALCESIGCCEICLTIVLIETMCISIDRQIPGKANAYKMMSQHWNLSKFIFLIKCLATNIRNIKILIRNWYRRLTS